LIGKDKEMNMLETKLYHPAISLMVHSSESDCLEISRLLAAAVVNPKFRHLLLEDPEMALEAGFQGESFSFTDEGRDLIKSIRACSLPDLAGQLARTFVVPVPVNHPVQLASSFGY
jgi:hypothetical protein